MSAEHMLLKEVDLITLEQAFTEDLRRPTGSEYYDVKISSIDYSGEKLGLAKVTIDVQEDTLKRWAFKKDTELKEKTR